MPTICAATAVNVAVTFVTPFRWKVTVSLGSRSNGPLPPFSAAWRRNVTDPAELSTRPMISRLNSSPERLMKRLPFQSLFPPDRRATAPRLGPSSVVKPRRPNLA